MARKKTEGKAMPATVEPKLKPVRLDLEHDAHRLLRMLAADSDVSMAAYAREALIKHLKEEAKRKGIKP